MEDLGKIIKKDFKKNRITDTTDIVRDLFRGLKHNIILLNNVNIKISNNDNNNNDDLKEKQKKCEKMVHKYTKSCIFVVDLMIDILNEQQNERLKNNWTNKVKHLICDEISFTPNKFKAYVAHKICNGISLKNSCGKAFDLLPKLIISLKHQSMIDLSLIS